MAETSDAGPSPMEIVKDPSPSPTPSPAPILTVDAAMANDGSGASVHSGSPRKGSKEEAKLAARIAKEEARSLREAKQKQKQRLNALREKQNQNMKKEGARSAAAKLRFLQEQADVFASFMGGADDVSGKKKGKKGKGGRGRAGRMTEEEGDKEMMKTLGKSRRTRLTVQPSCIATTKGHMRPYQIEGLNWLINLYEQGINGILADEMGLGKTLQSISLLGYLKNDRQITGPHIVIVPLVTLRNWEREFHTWCPSIRTCMLYGNKEERARQMREDMVADKFDVLLTTYETCIREKGAIQKFNWRYIVIDEAHRIKNENSTLAQTVRSFDTEFRLLITGTPLQNNLHELWALLNFLLPEVFSDSEMFEDFFKMDELGEESVVSKLHKILRPFLLRRLKVDVDKDLPSKREVKLYTGMSEMQTYWYKKLLSKDAAALNQLGGPGKTRLQNVLMQLRKVCNHPYLFQGAEIGPPYFDGPHLWENAGKMVLLDKLLMRLKANGDRVLIFSQMTRMLDVLEDYLRFKGYLYCRIDGSTKGMERQDRMDVFNAPDSDKFVFILSTRAGGLGINLQTANTVILYDSDWNPQMDLQAQDRAHRIGQKKDVTVFRFITEGTVEEKIVERAEKKLYLDAVVVQQGRLQESNQKLSKQDLMAMVKFGAEAIFKNKGIAITDEDIDLILEKGEKKTAEISAKYQTDVQHNLANFKLDDGVGETNFMVFEGEDYKEKRKSNFLDMGTRKRKKQTYDVNEYFREVLNDGSSSDRLKAVPRLPKGTKMDDFQFFNKARVEALEQKERDYIISRREITIQIREAKAKEKKEDSVARWSERNNVTSTRPEVPESERLSHKLEQKKAAMLLSEEELAEKQALFDEAFPSWNRRDYRAYVSACEKFGRSDVTSIAQELFDGLGKTKAETKRYHEVFWKRYTELDNYEKVIERIEHGEEKILRRQEVTEALDKIVARTKNPWQCLTLPYNTNRGKAFTEEEDRFLVCATQRLGYGNWDLLQLEIRKAWQFRFDWFLKSRTPAELARRVDSLIRMVEKANEAFEDEGSTKSGRAAKKAKR